MERASRFIADQRCGKKNAALFKSVMKTVCRYVDLIGDYVGASLMFLVAAGILFASARFWKKRTQDEGRQHEDVEHADVK